VWKWRTLIRQKLEVRDIQPLLSYLDIIIIVTLSIQVGTIIITEAMVG
jgi:hypothetical protein